MKTVLTNVYQLDELADAAKDKARQWFRETCDQDEWWDAVYEDFQRICAILGVELKEKGIYFSGFASQGDGACFEGSYAYRSGSLKEIRQYAPIDEKLHTIAETLQAVQRRNFYRLTANIDHRGRYYHEFSMDISEPLVAEALRDLARWLYRQLEKEDEYIRSDECVDENIEANEYTFTETGRRFG